MLIIRLYIYYICFSWQPEQRVKFGNVRLPPTDQAKKAEYKEGEIVEVMFIQLDSTHRLKVGIDMRNCSLTQKRGIGGVIVSVPTSSEVNRGFEPWWGQIKDYEIGIYVASLLSMQH